MHPPSPSADPCQAAYWEGRTLYYSAHATQRAEERALPVLTRFDPASLRLVDWDGDAQGKVMAVIFKVCLPRGGFFVTVTPYGSVVTLWQKGEGRDTAWRTWERKHSYMKTALRRGYAVRPDKDKQGRDPCN